MLNSQQTYDFGIHSRDVMEVVNFARRGVIYEQTGRFADNVVVVHSFDDAPPPLLTILGEKRNQILSA